MDLSCNPEDVEAESRHSSPTKITPNIIRGALPSEKGGEQTREGLTWASLPSIISLLSLIVEWPSCVAENLLNQVSFVFSWSSKEVKSRAAETISREGLELEITWVPGMHQTGPHLYDSPPLQYPIRSSIISSPILRVSFSLHWQVKTEWGGLECWLSTTAWA